MQSDSPKSPLSRLPAVHVLTEHADLSSATARFGRPAVVQAVRYVLAQAREAVKQRHEAPATDSLVEAVRDHLEKRPTLYSRTVNATGVVLHTNLGRAPLPRAAWKAMEQARDYCDLEMDLATGKRASRLRGVQEPLVAVTGAEAGMVVNNNAAAVLLGLAALAGTKPTAISRGHMVEIGGGFRLPTIMEASGSPLFELGTTNRTHLHDYRAALEAGVGLVLLVHRSNFVMQGYVSEPEPREVISLAHEYGVPVMLDLGSGALRDTTDLSLPKELTVPAAVALGFDAVCFSGDKLLGGPQAGFVVGKKEAIEALRLHPLARPLRCDKLQLAGIVATLDLYRRGEAERQIPVWRFLSTPPDELRVRAERWQAESGVGEVVPTEDAVGGGTLPDARPQSWALAIASSEPETLLSALRRHDPPVVAHIENDRVLLHPRTVLPEQDDTIINALEAARAHV